ncbi:cytochrome P450 [Pleomassaria siparia CBS 279.74]|uniref:Cytochrome P450 n=1 Tax=Pleomassaria siparia CBS 279.74 TaxID=1314801 RepID=A0A6G1JVB5_9PLEO|nr:cytochrome P450 [Pleomassaria siparia CBS 279.74]
MMENFSLATTLITLGLLLPTCLLYRVAFNIFLHPLSNLPGPRIWAAFRFPYCISLWKGKLVYDVFALHQKYGDVVRVAPNEISFANAQAWDDIYRHRKGHKPFPKNPIWWGELPGRAESIVSASTIVNHERLRKILGNCFTDRALAEEEPIVQSHVIQLTDKLHEKIEANGTMATVNIVDWFMFTTFDIIGDLSFGDPKAFGCLENSAYHPWVLDIFSYFKLGALFSTVRFYNHLARLIMQLMPTSVMKSQETNYQWATSKVHSRMSLEVQRRDFMSKILPHFDGSDEKNGKLDKMSLAELENNFYVMTVAGSETCGTVLSGTTNYLLKTPRALGKLVEEIRTTFPESHMLTFERLSKLPYLNAVIEEGLRLSPPVGGALAHVVPEGGDTVCGIWLPAGTNVGVHQWSLYRSSSKFHDANLFVPERWLESAYNDKSSPYYSDHRTAVHAFSTGSWSCIGKQLGLAELRLIIARLVWNFDMNIPSDGKTLDWGTQKQYVLIEKQGFDVQLTARPVAT